MPVEAVEVEYIATVNVINILFDTLVSSEVFLQVFLTGTYLSHLELAFKYFPL